MITVAEVEYVARLACLALGEEEKVRFTDQLNTMLTYVEQLNEVPTAGVEPTSHVLDLVNVFREDMVRQTLTVEEALRNAPEAAHDYFAVPRILD